MIGNLSPPFADFFAPLLIFYFLKTNTMNVQTFNFLFKVKFLSIFFVFFVSNKQIKAQNINKFAGEWTATYSYKSEHERRCRTPTNDIISSEGEASFTIKDDGFEITSFCENGRFEQTTNNDRHRCTEFNYCSNDAILIQLHQDSSCEGYFSLQRLFTPGIWEGGNLFLNDAINTNCSETAGLDPLRMSSRHLDANYKFPLAPLNVVEEGDEMNGSSITSRFSKQGTNITIRIIEKRWVDDERVGGRCPLLTYEREIILTGNLFNELGNNCQEVIVSHYLQQENPSQDIQDQILLTSNTLDGNNQLEPFKACADGSDVSLFTLEGNLMQDVGNYRMELREDPNGNSPLKYGTLERLVSQSNDAKIIYKYTHPKNFPLNVNNFFQMLNIDVYQNTLEGHLLVDAIPLYIYRVPVALVHGFYSNSDGFAEMKTKLLTDYPEEFVYLLDYRDSSTKPFSQNQEIVGNGLTKFKSNLYKEKIAVKKINVVAQSMGGIITRLYLQSLNYKDDIYKFIPLNVPHWGTQFANFMSSTSLPDNLPYLACNYFFIFDKPFDLCGVSFPALEDMEVDAPATTTLLNSLPSLNRNKVPTHCIASVVTPKSVISGNLMENGANWGIYATFLIKKIREIFNGEEHDVIVPLSSQLGGLAPQFTTIIPNQGHTLSYQNDAIIDKVKVLLKENLDSNNSSFTLDGFTYTPLTYNLTDSRNIASSRNLNSLKITSPSRGTIFQNKETIEIKFESSTNINRMAAIISESRDSSFFALLDDSNTEKVFLFPIEESNKLGKRELIVIGLDTLTDELVFDTTHFFINESTYDCSSLQKNIGDSCDDGNGNTTGETVQSNCTCGGGSTSFDCPTLQKNIGDSCDDNNSNTTGETIQSNCSCGGGNTIFNCPTLQKNIGDSCDDNDANTTNDQVQSDCTCQGTPIISGGEANCQNLQFNGNNGQIKISGLTASREKIEILGRNTDWQVVLICENDCSEPHIIPNLQTGSYKVKVQMYGADGSYCYHEEEVTVTANTCPDSDQDGTCDDQDICNGQAEPGSPCNDGDGNTHNDRIQADCSCKGETTSNNGGTANCNALVFTGTTRQISVSGLTGQNQKIEIIGRETNWQIVGICDRNCSNPQIINNLKPGEYQIKVQLYGSDNSYCYHEEMVIVPAINCPDSDGDGTCDDQDVCNGQAEPGSPCDDGDANTNNDEIQPDCSCKGESSTTDNYCDNIVLSNNDGKLVISNLTAPIEILDFYDENWQPIYNCTDNCGDEQIIEGLNRGKYHLVVKSYTADWKFICRKNFRLILTESEVEVVNDSRATQPQNLIRFIPHPAQNWTTIQLTDYIDQKAQIRILNYLGKEMKYLNLEKIPDNPIFIDLKDWTNGIYFVQIKLKNRPLMTQKLIVNRMY